MYCRHFHTGNTDDETMCPVMQIINEVRRFRVEYQGDPDLQPVRSYECTLLVELMAWIASHINKQVRRQQLHPASQTIHRPFLKSPWLKVQPAILFK